MKLNRRSLFGFMGGAAVAGPKMAAGLAEDVASGIGGYGSISAAATTATGWGPLKGSTLDDGSWKLARIANLKKLLTGEDEEEKHQRFMDRLHAAERVERFRLDGLRSVSAQHRMRMFIDSEEMRRAHISRIHASRELDELMGRSLRSL